MYRNGFTVDDGPLRDLTSLESRAFIASLENGDVPQGRNVMYFVCTTTPLLSSHLLTVGHLALPTLPAELAQAGPGGRPRNLEVQLSDKRGEDYVAPPPPAYVAFSGEGATLGGSGASSGATGAVAFTEAALAGVQVPPVDEAAPTTTLQVRTIQGKKIKIRINHSASVLQLAATIVR